MKKILIIPLLLFVNNIFSQNASHACSNLKIQQFNALQSAKKASVSGLDNYDEKYVKLELAVNSTSKYINGKCTHLIKVVAPTVNEFIFELIDELTVSDVKVNGTTTNFTHVNDEITIYPATFYNQNDLVSIEITYDGTPPAGSGFNSPTGLFNDDSPSWGTNVTWTLSEPYVAKTWWPCKQVLTDKIDSTLLIFTTEDSLKVGSNGLLVEESYLPNNKKRFTWKSNYPIDYYLISFACAPYQEYSYKILPEGVADSLLIQNYIYKDPNYIPTYENDMLEIGDMLLHFSDKFGQYPFVNEKYGHCIAPLNGGMEHQTMTTQGYFANWLTAHELGHQWWGNNVTCDTWNEIWINEGFASYSEYIYFQHFSSQAAADNDMLDRHTDIMSQVDGSVYVPDITNANRIFSGRLTYNKGAAVVHMLRNYLNNDSLFFHTLQVFQETFKYSTANTTDLKDIILQETSLDLTEFFDAWIYSESYPIYSGVFNTQNDTVFVNVDQVSAMANNQIVYPSPLELELFFDDGTSSIEQVENIYSNQAYYFLSEKEVTAIEVDPNNWILNDAGLFLKDETFSFPVVSQIVDLQANEWIVVKNPFNHELEISLIHNKYIESLSVFNILGQQIYKEENINTADFEIETATWNNGYYLLNVVSDNKEYVVKLLKN